MDDFMKFSPIAYRLGTKKGYLYEKSSLDAASKQFYVIYGNLLYSYRCEDPSSFISLTFLESSTIRLIGSSNSNSKLDNDTDTIQGFTITTVGGKIINLYGITSSDITDWIETIESYKYISLVRKFEDHETSAIQYQHLSEYQDNKIKELELKLEDLNKRNEESNQLIIQGNSHIQQLKSEIFELKGRISGLSNERLLLLQSRGVSPKSLPQWAIKRNEAIKQGRISADMLDMVKVWVGTWNLGGNDVFGNMTKDQSFTRLCPFLIPGYDIYVIGVQDCASDSIFECISSLLEREGCIRLNLNVGEVNGNGNNSNNNQGNNNSNSNSSNNQIMGNSSDLSKLSSRLDGSILSQRFTGIAVYVRRKIRSEVKLLKVVQIGLVSGQNKGVVAVSLSIYDRTVLFISSYLDTTSKQEIRRMQYQQIVTLLGSKLGEESYHINEQFNHIIWFGDMNSRLVDTSGNSLPADTAVQMLEDNLQKSLFESHDQLRQDKKNQIVFYAYREPVPYPNFYPTYKKYQNRLPHDYANKSWVKDCYKYKYKAPFYKGGGMKEKTPAFCDRILYHSMVDLGEDLVPECIDETLLIYPKQDHRGISSSSSPLLKESSSPSPLSSSSSAAVVVAAVSSSSSFSSKLSPRASTTATTGMNPSFNTNPNSTRQLSLDWNEYGMNGTSVVGEYGLSNEPKLPQSMTSIIDNYQSVNDGEIFSISDHSPVFGTFLLRLRKDYEPFKRELIERLGEGKGNIKDLLLALQRSDSPSTKLSDKSDISVPSLSTPGEDKNDDNDKVTINVSMAIAMETNDPSSSLKDLSKTSPVTSLVTPSNPIQVPKFDFTFSLLPHRTYKISLSGIRLLWGSCEDTPSYVKILFPAPYESLGGEKFVDFYTNSQSQDMGSGFSPDISNFVASPSSAQESSRLSYSGRRSSRSRNSLSPTYNNSQSNLMPSQINPEDVRWRKVGSSKTGTCVIIECESAKGILIPPIQLVWRGNEPLDRLHIALQARMAVTTFHNSSVSKRDDELNGDTVTGHCSLSLEQLCKAALVATGGESGRVSMTRQLLKDGLPLYSIDHKALQREQVTLVCTLDLLGQ